MDTLLNYTATVRVSLGPGAHKETDLTMGRRPVVVGRTTSGELFSFGTGCRVGGECDFFATSSGAGDLTCSSLRCTYSPEQRRIVFSGWRRFYRLSRQSGSPVLGAMTALYRLATLGRRDRDGFVTAEPCSGEVELRCRLPSPPEGASGWHLT